MTETLSTALDRKAEPAEAKNVRQIMEANAVEFARKLPPGLQYDYFKQAVYSEMRRTPKLWECDPLSTIGAVAQALQLGLAPGVQGHVYFVPFKKECQLIVGYKGKLALAFRSEQVKDVATGIVYEGDAFTFRKGTRPQLDHTPSGPPGERDFTHVYAVARLRAGGTPFEVLFPSDIDAAIKLSPTGSKGYGPWVDFPNPMRRKTAVHRLAPYLPQSALFARAAQWDDGPAIPIDELPDASEPLPESEATDDAD